MSLLTELRTAIPLACFISVYFYFKPDVPTDFSFFFFVMWLCFFTLDAKITIMNSNLMHHEKNLVFPALFYKFGKKLSPVLHFAIEIIIMMLIVSLFEGRLVLASISIMALVFGLAHLDGYLSNLKTITKIAKRKM